MTDNDRIRKSISATLSEIEQAPSQWQQLGDVIEALEIIRRIERRLSAARWPVLDPRLHNPAAK